MSSKFTIFIINLLLFAYCSAFSIDFLNYETFEFETDVHKQNHGKQQISDTESEQWNATIWAVLVAGSNGWYNYRHQADICHAYQVLREHGIADKNIIVMMYDDIAHNEQNPTAGIIINKPGGRDVYKGVPKDYINNEVTPEMLLKVLQGDKTLAAKGRKVVKSGPNDHIFLYFSDHGAPGLIAFPSDELYATTLNKVLKQMANQKKFAKMVIYIEACESGSMFSGLLPNNINIFATTASNATESSYACYYDELRETYLGDVYSVNWIEDSDARSSLASETLQQQFKEVLKETNTSHVKEYGDTKIGRLAVSQFQGSKAYNNTDWRHSKKVAIVDAVVSSDVPIAIARNKISKYSNPEHKHSQQVKYEQMLRSRQYLVKSMQHLVLALQLPDVSFDSIWNDKNAITNHDCYINLLEIFDKHCFDLSTHPFALRFLYVFVNMCESLGKEVNEGSNWGNDEGSDEGSARIIEDWISTIVQHCSRHVSGHPFKQIL